MAESRYADFRVIKEGWNEYKLEDGTTVKLRFILIKLINQPNGFAISSTIVPGIFPSPDLIGSPSQGTYSPQELEKSIEKKDLQFESVKEDWNVYELKDRSKLSIKPILVSISRTNLHDQHGEPIYAIQPQQIIKKI